MDKAAYDKAKRDGELLEQRLTNLVEMEMPLEACELSILAEAAHLLEWYGSERDSLISEVDELKRRQALATAEVQRKDAILAAIKRYTLSAQEMSSGQVMAPLSQILIVIDKGVPVSGRRSQGECETTLTERFYNPDCVCDTYQGNLGPCKTFEVGASGDCVYCEHSKECHRSLVDGVSADSKQPHIIEREGKMSGPWWECSECGDELQQHSGDGGVHLECGKCGHEWYEGEYIKPTVDDSRHGLPGADTCSNDWHRNMHVSTECCPDCDMTTIEFNEITADQSQCQHKPGSEGSYYEGHCIYCGKSDN